MEGTMPDYIFVGGGICGLQLAAMLASDGKEVLVLEKLRHAGGRAFLWEKDGFTVDNGIHLIRFGPKSATARVFRHIKREIAFTDLGKSFVGFPDGRVVDFPTGPIGFLTTRLMSVGERLKALALMVKLRNMDLSGLLETSVRDWMDQNNITGGMRDYFHLVSASMQVCPYIERSSVGEMLLNVKSVLQKGRSAMYPTRGWAYIYDCLTQAIEENGKIRTETKVKRVIVEDGKAKGVELESGEQIMGGRVVINLPAQKIFEVLEEGLTLPEFVSLCKGLRPTAGVVLDYGLKRRISPDSGLWYLYKPMSFGMFTSNLCPELAPPGKQLLTWLLPAEPEEMADKEKAAKMQDELEAAIFRTFKGLEEAIEWKRALSLTMVDGVEVNVSQHRGKRPGYKVPGVEGLFLVGDSLKGPGAGGDVGHESVLECYREITGREA